MGYLRLQDYYNKRIQQAQLNQITQNRDAVRISCEIEAVAQATSYLVQRYDLAEELTDTAVFSSNLVFKPKDRFELNALDYNPLNTYTAGQTTLYQGNVYYCKNNITVPEAFNLNNWTLIGAQYDLFYVDIPYSYYDYKVLYNVGDRIFYKGKIYKCLISNSNLSPLDPDNGREYWGVGYSIIFTGYYPFNTPNDLNAYNNVTSYVLADKVNYNGVAYVCIQPNTGVLPDVGFSYWCPIGWVKGDNRSQQLVPILLDLSLRKIHNLIAPNNVPQVREDNYDMAIQWLKEAGGQNNAITADIPLLQPLQGKRIRWGSSTPKNENSY